MPCEGNGCDACHDGMPYRWHAYTSAEDAKTCLHFIFECTAQAAEPFKDYRKAHNTLRGCLFEARRWNSKINGRILIRTTAANLTERRLAQPPDLKKCMAIIWNLTEAEVGSERINPDKQMPAVLPKTDRDSTDPNLKGAEAIGKIIQG